MKIFLSIFILSISVSAFGQINKRTANLRKQYPAIASFNLKEEPMQSNFKTKFPHSGNDATGTEILSTELQPKPSMHSIEKALNYYNSLKKPADYSGFLMTGYSVITNRALINQAPQESIRFFPANARD